MTGRMPEQLLAAATSQRRWNAGCRTSTGLSSRPRSALSDPENHGRHDRLRNTAVVARLLTIDDYRKYRRFIPLGLPLPVWLATGWTTKSSQALQ